MNTTRGMYERRPDEEQTMAEAGKTWVDALHGNAIWLVALGVFEVLIGAAAIFVPFLAGIAATVVIGGMLLDGVSMVYVFMPILMPLMKQFHWDPVWFGVMVTIMVAIGTITPPVAMNLYVGCRISGLTIEELTPPVIPLMLATLIALLVLTAFPSITLMLPRYLGFM